MNYETIEIDVTTNEVKLVEVVLSQKEIEEGEKIRLERQAELDSAIAEKQAILAKLGITEEQAKLLLS